MTNREFVEKFVPDHVKSNFLEADPFILGLKYKQLDIDIMYSAFPFGDKVEYWLEIIAITDMKYRSYLMEQKHKKL